MAKDLQMLLDSGALSTGDELYHPRMSRTGGGEVTARVVEGGVEFAGKVYPSLSTASRAASSKPTNGWTYWRLRRSGRPMSELRTGDS